MAPRPRTSPRPRSGARPTSTPCSLDPPPGTAPTEPQRRSCLGAGRKSPSVSIAELRGQFRQKAMMLFLLLALLFQGLFPACFERAHDKPILGFGQLILPFGSRHLRT